MKNDNKSLIYNKSKNKNNNRIKNKRVIKAKIKIKKVNKNQMRYRFYIIKKKDCKKLQHKLKYLRIKYIINRKKSQKFLIVFKNFNFRQ